MALGFTVYRRDEVLPGFAMPFRGVGRDFGFPDEACSTLRGGPGETQ